MEKEEVKVLDELNKGACMGIDAIELIIDKVCDDGLKKELKAQHDAYTDITKKIAKVYKEYSKSKPKETSCMNQKMTMCAIDKMTLTDCSTSKIAELLMQGTNMGIIEGRRLLNNKDVPQNIKEIIEDFVDVGEDAVESLKPFL